MLPAKGDEPPLEPGVVEQIKGHFRKVAEDRFGDSSLQGILWNIFVGSERALKPEEHWSNARRKVSRLVASNAFEMGMGLVILINMVVMCIETDRRANDLACIEDQMSVDCPANNADIYYFDLGCMVIYCVELALRIYAAQRKFCHNGWNAFDSLVVVTSVIGHAFGSVLGNAQMFRLVRIVKLLRIFRHLTIFPELYLMLAAMASTMRTIFWAMLMLGMVLIVCSFLAVQIIHPVMKDLVDNPEDNPTFDAEDCQRCAKSFNSIQSSMITFFQTLIMGDGIGDFFIPVMEKDFGAALFLLACVAIVYLGFSNLILSVIVEKANEARHHDSTYRDMVDRKVKEDAKKEVTHLWHELEDTDGSSHTMSLQELKHLHNTSARFRDYFKRLDIDMPFLEYAFKIMDADGSGDCSLEDFAASVVQLKTTDPGPVVSYIKHQITQVVNDVAELKSFLLQTERGSLAERLAVQDQLEPASKRVLDPNLSPRPLAATPRPVIILNRPEADAAHSTERSNSEIERIDATQTTRNKELAGVSTTMGPDALNVFKMTLQEEQRLLVAESQRRPGTSLSSSPRNSVLQVHSQQLGHPQQLVATAPSREQSEELVEMLKKAYEKPSSSKAMGRQHDTVREGQVLSSV